MWLKDAAVVFNQPDHDLITDILLLDAFKIRGHTKEGNRNTTPLIELHNCSPRKEIQSVAYLRASEC